MNSDTRRNSSRTEDERIYRLRRKNFQRNLVTKMSYLGYIVIVLYYLKYGCTIWNLMLRVCVQSLLAVPFPSDIQIQRLSRARENRGSAHFFTLSGTMDAETVPMPGAFPSGDDSQTAARSEAQMEEESKAIKRKIRKVLFHGSLTFNVLFIISALIFPVNFIGKLEGNHLLEAGLANTPSPFNNANGIIQGERKGGFSMQMIGETLPQTNFKGNLGIVMFEFTILLCQFTLFVLTCINFADLGDQKDVDGDHSEAIVSDGYDGKVDVTRIDPIGAISDIVFPMIETANNTSSMV
ncbi:hypothetical protein HG536_0G01690 [Torulaspora globosa]|uniref:DUF1746 domain-containing protein n=1 Tax=Torulaspora globosa TaxID=48254 RepID=A0A7G3ZLC4_9SACH|nr:uncharacterized protein HG536_0G01690 [Torulaspora globosa]QLL34310.1 hypothetical protein HG536_0G01690 [Torulaspora globosa]